MRLIGIMRDPEKAKRFSSFLRSKNIENQIEVAHNTDWGSEEYGDANIQVWVLDEDRFPEAMDWLEQFHENPADPQFDATPMAGTTFTSDEMEELQVRMESTQREPAPLMTIYILIACILLFLSANMTEPVRERVRVPYPYTPIYSSELVHSMLIDYPKAYDLLTQIVSRYGIEGLQDPNAMPPEGQALLVEYRNTPYWQGAYEDLVLSLKGEPLNARAPLFEKVRQGQIWRLVTPAFLHLGFLHLLFNMLWLIVLGRQIEKRLGPYRYLFFILLAAIFSNVAQYFVSGPDFLGFSGVVCAMFGFIWMRQMRAGWEGYQLDKSTIMFISIFILAMLGIQVASFFIEVYSGTAIAPMIANTAHLAGAAIGALMGRMNFFAWKQ